MSKTLSTMKTNVGNYVQDTSSTFATLIPNWINDKYTDIGRSCLWSSLVNFSKTITTVVGTSTYDLPTDFDQELFVADITNGHMLERNRESDWWRDRHGAYSSGSISNGNPLRYIILEATRQIKLDPPPDAVDTIAIPYKRLVQPLIGITGTCDTNTTNKIIASSSTFITSGVTAGMRVKNTTDSTYGYVVSVDSETQLTMDGDLCPDGNETFAVSNEVVIPDTEHIIELGASGEAWAYKRQLAKADYYFSRYEIEKRKRIGQERSKINQLYQLVSETYRVTGSPRPLTGELSYDSL